MKEGIFAVAIVMLLTASCAREVFTENIRDRIEQQEASDLERLQYYNDLRIVLTYTSTTKDNSVKAGKVEFVDGIYRYFVEIPKLTPGIGKPYNDKVIQVFFDEGENSYLLFERKDDKGDDMRRSNPGRYQLALAKEKDGNYVRFEGKKFRVVEGEDAVLMIDKQLRHEDDTDKRKLKGVRVSK